MASVQFSATGVSIGTSYTKLYETLIGSDPDLSDYKACGLDIENTGATAFTGFEVRVYAHSAQATPNTILSVSADFTDPLADPLMMVAPNNIFTLAGGAQTHIAMWVWSMRKFELWAKVGAGTTTASIYGILK